MRGSITTTLARLDKHIEAGTISTASFKTFVRSFYRRHRRVFPWRRTRDPYRIMVSEVMLQQTQTDRVIPKYRAFLERFPSWGALAQASSAEVMQEWRGLGYYRRAFNLHRTAQIVTTTHRGKLPRNLSTIRALPGVGSYTAGAVSAFAFGVGAPIIETNIRTVFLYTFFSKRRKVADREILPLIEATLDHKNPREWYYALMDLGSELKKHRRGINARSKHHVQQTPYHGSNRQVRAQVLKLLADGAPLTETAARRALELDAARLGRAVSDLEREGLVRRTVKGALALA